MFVHDNIGNKEYSVSADLRQCPYRSRSVFELWIWMIS